MIKKKSSGINRSFNDVVISLRSSLFKSIPHGKTTDLFTHEVMATGEVHVRFQISAKVQRNVLESVFHTKNTIQAGSNISTVAISFPAVIIPVTTVIETYVRATTCIHHPFTVCRNKIEVIFIQTRESGISPFVVIGMRDAFDCMRPLDEMFDRKAYDPWIHTGAKRRFIIGRRSASYPLCIRLNCQQGNQA